MPDLDEAPASPQGPDLMNDPAFEQNTIKQDKGVDEPDTCRICRGEGSIEEPLFYPCKCSGSIKFVHQSCLMEWLSHSQKKHCELCKTPFRFTKLYHPQMPKIVPLPIFLRQVALNTFNGILAWARWLLVAFVWLGWVPWCMRTVWRGLFWIGDGAWINWKIIEMQSPSRRLDKLITRQSISELEPVVPTNIKNFSIASMLFRKLPTSLRPISQTLNFTAEPTMIKGIRYLIQRLQLPHLYDAKKIESVTQNNTATIVLAERSPSLLSDFTFLTSLTRWRTVNNLVIDTLEGQLITLSICVAFILIFLIREWVVQQAPGINMGAAIDAAAVAQPPAPPVPQLQRLARQHAEQELGGIIRNEEARVRNAEAPQIAQPPHTPEQENTVEERLQKLSEPLNGDEAQPSDWNAPTSPEQSALEVVSSNRLHVQSSNELKVEMTEDTLKEQDSNKEPSKESPRASTLMDYLRRADGDPGKVIALIRSDGRSEELEWIILYMRSQQRKRSRNTSAESSDANDPNGTMADSSVEQASDGSGESWQVVGDNAAYSAGSATNPFENFDASFVAESSDDADSHQLRERRQGTSSNRRDESSSPATSPSLHKNKQRATLDLPEASESFAGRSRSLGSRLSSDELTNWPPSPPLTPQPQSTFDQSHLPPTNSAVPSTSHDSRAIDDEAPESLTSRQSGPAAQASAIQHPARETFGEKITEWLWGGVAESAATNEEQLAHEERVVEDIAREAPFVPVARGQPLLENGNNVVNPGQDPEVVRAAVEAGINPNQPEAVEDGEDLEGIMELLGIQGPIAGLIQNGIFSAILISMTVFLGIWVPYIAGKMVLVFLANPISLLIKLPLRWASSLADLVIDSFIFIVSFILYWIDNAAQLILLPLGWAIPFLKRRQENRIVAMLSLQFAQSALQRLEKMFIATGDTLSDSDIPVFSIIAHESLQHIEQKAANLTTASMDRTLTFFRTVSAEEFNVVAGLRHAISRLARMSAGFIGYVPKKVGSLSTSLTSATLLNPMSISLTIPHRTKPLDYSLAEWSTRDRVSAIILGYMAFSLAGFFYLKLRTIFRDARAAEKPEGTITNILFQAGGIMKVILIISIEMIVFPLYCGLLLDVALLPLFENRSLVSRMEFTFRSPATSLFVHWFIGTCYMFHFALFVSMCRKIMRNGVLYFIRDPDDPTFHPVRDVLERSVTTQLRKIAFSAMVYGALVVVCLGGVVWGLSYAIPPVFPIHWSSNEPVLEFPVDLLFYNFLMPVAIKFFRPSSGLNRMYGWWFRKCARMLRLSEFMFGDRREDEEGHRPYTSWLRFWKNWYDLSRPKDQLTGKSSLSKVSPPDFVPDGMYVRAPASDQVRIPKGAHTFVQVTPNNTRIDGQPDSCHGLHGKNNKGFIKLYIPPYFRLRIGIFIFLIWAFAAITGVSFTILPLIWGRFLFSALAPPHLRVNDIYAFAIGIYSLGGPVYVGLRYKSTILESYRSIHQQFQSRLTSYLSKIITRAIRLTYLYGSLTLLMPSLFALLMELYLVIPLHTYSSTLPSHNPSVTSPSPSPTNLPAQHTVHFIQDWTLGVLYVKSAIRLILWYNNSRPAHALRAIVAGPQHGWLNPDIRLATRAFILPVTVVSVALILLPLGLGWSTNHLLNFAGSVSGNQGTKWTEDQVFQACIYRYAYPGLLGLCFGYLAAKRLVKGLSRWRDRVRDEVYLIGERLHNFGEGRGAGVANAGRRARMMTN